MNVPIKMLPGPISDKLFEAISSNIMRQPYSELQHRDLELEWMKLVEGQWRPLEQERLQVQPSKKYSYYTTKSTIWPMRIF
jgi:hypothetical protein